MERRPDELEAMKRIDLADYAAAAYGFELDRRKSSRSWRVLRDAHGEKLLVGLAPDGHFVYQNLGDDGDVGSIVDFEQRRGGGSLGDVRRKLRPYLNQPPRVLPAWKPQPMAKDVFAVRARYEAAERVSDAGGNHPYLCEQRAVPAALLASERFAGRVRLGQRGEALAGHYNAGGLCGYEAKNQGYASFASSGQKGLWGSNLTDQDNAMAISEAVISLMPWW